jgi:hypothetical protein
MLLKPLPTVLIAALLAGCASSNTAGGPAVASAGNEDRAVVIRCFATGHRKRVGMSPILDEKTDAAADQLLKKYGGSTRKACDAIASSQEGAACAGAATLSGLMSCDRRLGRAAEVDPASKAQLEAGVRANEQEGGSRQRQFGF